MPVREILQFQVAVRRVLKGLLDNLKKYPQDKSSIYKCVRGVGGNNPNYVALLAPEMLRFALFCCGKFNVKLLFLERVKNWGCRKAEGSNKTCARRWRNLKIWPAWNGQIQLFMSFLKLEFVHKSAAISFKTQILF